MRIILSQNEPLMILNVSGHILLSSDVKSFLLYDYFLPEISKKKSILFSLIQLERIKFFPMHFLKENIFSGSH